MGNLKRLMDICSGSVFVNINEHRDYYMTAKDYLRSLRERGQVLGIAEGAEDEMVRLNRVVHVQWYIDTPVSSSDVYHHDLNIAIETALEIAEEHSLER